MVSMAVDYPVLCGESYFMSEELHEILQLSSNKDYIEDEDWEGSNVEIEEEADETCGGINMNFLTHTHTHTHTHTTHTQDGGRREPACGKSVQNASEYH